jgi:hypothetical protein
LADLLAPSEEEPEDPDELEEPESEEPESEEPDSEEDFDEFFEEPPSDLESFLAASFISRERFRVP